ncbi:MAG: Smr/MutS family protein, partial [Bdellovibrionota bacterium]
TVYVEPQEAVPINNRIREIEIEIEAEIDKLLNELSEYLATWIDGFSQSREALLEFDIRSSQAQLAIAINGRRCTFTDEESNFEILLKDLRHPLLILNNVKVIPSQVTLNSEKRILLLSGPNAGGKTVLLKALGLAAQMSRCGLLICAHETSKIPFFKNITVSIGDQQSVDANLSTFAAHLKTLNVASNQKGPQHLLLIDEICGSTDPEEGAALARSFLEFYAENKVFGVISSHLGALKLGWSDTSGVINGSLEFDKVKGPTYQFLMGVPGQSLAIQTAKRVGVDEKIVNKALGFLTPEHRQYQRDLEQVDQLRSELHHLTRTLEEEKAKTEKERERYTSIIEKFQTEKEKMLNQSIKRAEKKVDVILRESKIEDIFKRHQDLEKIKTELPVIIKASKKNAPEDTTQQIESAEEFIERFPPGSKVFIKTVGRDGIVQGKPNSKGEIPVLSQSMRFMVVWTDLRSPEVSGNPTRDIIRRAQNVSFLPADEDRTVDLRGMNSEEAISQLEIQLDTASIHQEDRVKIIHGHGGSDILKKAVRSYLSRSVYVKKWQAGNKDSGGDGVTWAEIKD